jgi:hypothetical protein
MDVSKIYMDGRRMFVHGAFSWRSRTSIFVEVKRQGYLRVRDNRIISSDKMAPGKNSSHLGKQHKGKFKGSTENVLF